jgi:hypothetical protein
VPGFDPDDLGGGFEVLAELPYCMANGLARLPGQGRP